VIINKWNKTYEAIQTEIKENPDNDNLKLICDNEISLKKPPKIQIQESDQVNINDIVNNLVDDVKGREITRFIILIIKKSFKHQKILDSRLI